MFKSEAEYHDNLLIVTPAFWRCRKPLDQRQRSFQMKALPYM